MTKTTPVESVAGTTLHEPVIPGHLNKKLNVTILEKIGRSGSAGDVDFLMSLLVSGAPGEYCKMTDYALGLTETGEGRLRILHYLYHGEKIQRNYAALWFKRRNAVEVLEEAVENGCIDSVQAWSR